MQNRGFPRGRYNIGPRQFEPRFHTNTFGNGPRLRQRQGIHAIEQNVHAHTRVLRSQKRPFQGVQGGGPQNYHGMVVKKRQKRALPLTPGQNFEREQKEAESPMDAKTMDALLSSLSNDNVIDLRESPKPLKRQSGLMPPVPQNRSLRRRRIEIPDKIIKEYTNALPDESTLWAAGKKELLANGDATFELVYLSKKKRIQKLPVLKAVVRSVKPPPNNLLLMLMPKALSIDLNNAHYIPFTRHLNQNYRPSFTLEFDLSAKESKSPESVFKKLDSNKIRIAETLTSFIVGNNIFECNEMISSPDLTESLVAHCNSTKKGSEALTTHRKSASEKYRVYLVPQFVGDVSSDSSYASGKIDEYVQDYLKLNTEWSYAPPEALEKMKAGVTGVRFKVYVLPERELDEWAESLYRQTFRSRKLHLILDLDKTIIRAFNEDSLDSITKLKEEAKILDGDATPIPEDRNGKLPKELKGTESFKIKFTFGGKETELWVKPRPFLREFLEQIAKDYEISVLSMGVPQYVAQVVKGITKIYPSIAEAIPPSRVLSSAYTMTKVKKKGSKDLRMLYPFCRFSDRRNSIAIVDDTMDVWEGRESFRKLVFPISRYEGFEHSEMYPKRMKSSLEKCLEKLKRLKSRFYQEAENLAKSMPGPDFEANLLQCCRRIKVADLWPKILKN
eukprot:CAMPEP_0114505494 /NCGR_PEP_ID=MMETSP0109-20121206/10885_1 /TAXON_ID=29199 /ORGANISM="Chlorarachnion reptans, Strain CCCM449" /LENGTH=672 /DNA_ID=CAMNT_0001683941 /DNA_START=325 /DNA_END=2343 /DNA_ORIENTATION=-